MKALFLMFLIPALSHAGSPPACSELGTIVTNYEKELQSAFIKDCGKFKAAELVEGIKEAVDPEFLEERKCSDLATIEAELERLKNEQAILDGFKKLKATIQASKVASGSREPAKAQRAGRTFLGSLNTAQSFEVLFNTVSGQDKKFLAEALKDRLKSVTEPVKGVTLQNIVKELCKGEDQKGENACNPTLFVPSDEAAAELLNLLKNNNVDTKNISAWQKQLLVRKKGKPEAESAYSFTEMQRELAGALGKIDSGERLTKKEFLAIQRLDDFENAKGFDFIDNIASLKKHKETRIAADKFLLLVGDAKIRQQFEAQAKMSYAWERYKHELLRAGVDEAQSEACEEARYQLQSLKTCHEAMARLVGKLSGDSRANLDRLLKATEVSLSYINDLDSTETKCSQELKLKGEFSPECVKKFTDDEATIAGKIVALNLLKEKIGAGNQDKMQYRNFALQKWDSQKCGKISSSMDLCEEGALIAPEMMVAVGDTLKITAMYAPKTESEASVKEMCEDDEKAKKTSERRLCEFFNDTTSDIVMPRKNDEIDGPVRAPNGGLAQDKIRDAWIGGGANLLREALGYLVKPTPPPGIRNPYPYNYVPFNGGKPPMGIADTIIFNARFEGAYGFYMPTAGYQPHNLGSGYRPVSQPSLSPYFSR